MDAFELFFEAYHIKWLVPIIAILIVGGSIGEVSSWLLGPSKGFLVSSGDGVLPPLFQRVNRKGIPVNILLMQAIIVTVLMLVFVLMPNVSSAYWILTAMNAQLYLIMYVIMFVAVLALRYKRPDAPRPFRIGRGNALLWIVVVIAIIGAVFTIFIGFFPPSQLKTGSIWFYELFLIVGIIVMTYIPLLIYRFRKPSWATWKPDPADED